MDHHQATQSAAVEKYLLDELAPEVRDEFEEHFFDCQDCATDLRATEVFMGAARKEFRLHPIANKTADDKKPRLTLIRPLLVWAALAASLLVIVYQNVLVYPTLKTELAAYREPEILPSVSLVGGNSRGGQIPAAAVIPKKPFLLLLDIPTQDRFTSYTCLLYAPSGSLAWRVEVSPQVARDTVSISVPPAEAQPGAYALRVQGNAAGNAVDLAQYHFNLKNQD